MLKIKTEDSSQEKIIFWIIKLIKYPNLEYE